MVGKKAGDSLYIHASALIHLPLKVQVRVVNAMINVPRSFKHNFILINPKYIALIDAENFDKDFEPVLGERYKVYTNGKVEHIQRENKPKILHQRYKTVSEDYNGFDIVEDKKREEWYRKHFDAKAMAGAGYKHNWEKMLESI